MLRPALLLAAATTLSACTAARVVDTAVGVVKLPVKVASAGIDAATTSQSEADQKRGRQIRQREERLGRLEGRYAREMDKCQEGDRSACDQARETYAEMQMLMPSVPAEPEA